MRTWVVGFLLIGLVESSALAQSSPDLTATDRLRWIADRTVGPLNLAGLAVSAAIRTADNNPREYGPHWDGWGKRMGLSESRVATSNVMEAGLGAIWNENPYYRHTVDQPFKSRVFNVAKQTVLDKNERPAYARYIAYFGSSYLSTTWRPDSQRNFDDATIRALSYFGAKFIGNAFREFGPDVKRRVLRQKRTSTP
jgi:hypothetical protein